MPKGKIDLDTLSDSERAMVEARRAYQREWREKNKEKVTENNRRFYLRRANKAKK